MFPNLFNNAVLPAEVMRMRNDRIHVVVFWVMIPSSGVVGFLRSPTYDRILRS